MRARKASLRFELKVFLGYNVKLGHTPRHAGRIDICLKRLRHMCQERVGLTNSSHDQG